MGKFKAILEGASKMMEKDARKPSQPQYNDSGRGVKLIEDQQNAGENADDDKTLAGEYSNKAKKKQELLDHLKANPDVYKAYQAVHGDKLNTSKLVDQQESEVYSEGSRKWEGTRESKKKAAQQ